MATVWVRRYPPTVVGIAGTHVWATRKVAGVIGKDYTFELPFIPYRTTDKIWVFGQFQAGEMDIQVTDYDNNKSKKYQFINTGTYEDIVLYTDLENMTLNKGAVVTLHCKSTTIDGSFRLRRWGVVYVTDSTAWVRRFPPATTWTRRNI